MVTGVGQSDVDLIAAEAPRHGIRTRAYHRGTLEREDFPLEELRRYVNDPDWMAWADIPWDDPATLAEVAGCCNLHHLAVQDAGGTHQRPKLDRYSGHAFVNLYAVTVDASSGALESAELSAFLLPNVLVTIRKGERFDIDQVVRQWDSTPDLMQHGVAALVHGLVDVVVDGHFVAVQRLEECLEQLEDALFETKSKPRDLHRRTFVLRKSLATLRRLVLPMREVVSGMMRRELGIGEAEMVPYFEDVYDHALRVADWTEGLRDVVTSLLESNISMESNSLNVTTKKVTSWAAIIAVPTLVTGFYGMNVPYPGYDTRAGLFSALAILMAGSLALYVLFKRKDWI